MWPSELVKYFVVHLTNVVLWWTQILNLRWCMLGFCTILECSNFRTRQLLEGPEKVLDS